MSKLCFWIFNCLEDDPSSTSFSLTHSTLDEVRAHTPTPNLNLSHLSLDFFTILSSTNSASSSPTDSHPIASMVDSTPTDYPRPNPPQTQTSNDEVPVVENNHGDQEENRRNRRQKKNSNGNGNGFNVHENGNQQKVSKKLNSGINGKGNGGNVRINQPVGKMI